MKIPPWILGVAALMPVGGALAGASMNTDPIGTGSDVVASLPDRPAITIADAAPRTQERLPDHYPMMTPQGRVEVHELSIRGRHADRWRAGRAYQARYEADLVALESRWADNALDSRAARALDAQQPYVPGRDHFADAAAPKPAPSQPLDLEQPQSIDAAPQFELAVTTIEPPQARSINVAAELAARSQRQ